MNSSFDFIVCGLGAAGGATLHHLAQRGYKVLGLDRFHIPHNRGSSHAQTRLIRKAYFEHPDYVPLLQRAYALWDRLKQDAREPLLVTTGMIAFAKPDHPVAVGIKSAAQQHGLAVETLTPAEVRSLNPVLVHPEGYDALYEAEAGYLNVDPCLTAHITSAVRRGARVAFDQPVLAWNATPQGVTVITSQGTYAAKRLVLTAGAWMGDLAHLPGVTLQPHRVPLFWFSGPKTAPKAKLPCFAYQLDSGFFYGVPLVGAGGVLDIKIGLHKPGAALRDANDHNQDWTDDDVAPVREFISTHLPSVSTTPNNAAVCIYTMTKDEHFVLDRHPLYPNVIVGSPCSGHGFKFAPVIGEILADLAEKGSTQLPAQFLSLERFGITSQV